MLHYFPEIVWLKRTGLKSLDRCVKMSSTRTKSLHYCLFRGKCQLRPALPPCWRPRQVGRGCGLLGGGKEARSLLQTCVTLFRPDHIGFAQQASQENVLSTLTLGLVSLAVVEGVTSTGLKALLQGLFLQDLPPEASLRWAFSGFLSEAPLPKEGKESLRTPTSASHRGSFPYSSGSSSLHFSRLTSRVQAESLFRAPSSVRCPSSVLASWSCTLCSVGEKWSDSCLYHDSK